MTRNDAEILERLADISRDLLNEPEAPATMFRITAGAVELVPGCDDCGISLRDRGGAVSFAGATSSLAETCDGLQDQFQEGPCLDAVTEEEVTLVHDLALDPRWPSWAARAVQEGVRSMLSLRLYTQEATLGALNLYGRRPGAFTDDDVDLAWAYAGTASSALRGARRTSGLASALNSRHTIGLAQGIMMGRYGLSADRSFEVLRRYSSETNIKIRDVAQSIVDGGSLPGPVSR